MEALRAARALACTAAFTLACARVAEHAIEFIEIAQEGAPSAGAELHRGLRRPAAAAAATWKIATPRVGAAR